MCDVCGCDSAQGVTIEHADGSHTHVLPDGTELVHRHAHGEERHEHGEGSHTHVLADGTELTHRHAHGEQRHEHGEGSHMHVLADGTELVHRHAHGQERHDHGDGALRIEPVAARILSANDQLALRNRGYFEGRELLALNLMSSPGAGKTTLLEATLRALDVPAAVLEGDQETVNDAARIRATGAPAIQINTGKGCHLEADMVWRGLAQLQPKAGSVLFIENVGNLVCPALFDLGEHARVVLFSVTEGEDKPLKYPHMFRVADIVLITKIDLAEACDFDRETAHANVRRIAPDAPILELSAKRGNPEGAGMDGWLAWIRSQHRAQAAQA